MNLYPHGILPIREVRKFIVIFYIVGVCGFLIPFVRELFIYITPLALLLCTYLLAAYHKQFNTKSILAFLIVFFIGFMAEVAGVNTGLIFGNYWYGKGLGPKIFETPLMIGSNWLFLSYASVSIINTLSKTKVSDKKASFSRLAQSEKLEFTDVNDYFENKHNEENGVFLQRLINKLRLNILLKIIAASLLMVTYDLVLEQAASKMDMWHWKNDIIPLQNYIAWFGISILVTSIYYIFRVKAENPLALILFVCQFIFLAILSIFM